MTSEKGTDNVHPGPAVLPPDQRVWVRDVRNGTPFETATVLGHQRKPGGGEVSGYRLLADAGYRLLSVDLRELGRGEWEIHPGAAALRAGLVDPVSVAAAFQVLLETLAEGQGSARAERAQLFSFLLGCLRAGLGLAEGADTRAVLRAIHAARPGPPASLPAERAVHLLDAAEAVGGGAAYLNEAEEGRVIAAVFSRLAPTSNGVARFLRFLTAFWKAVAWLHETGWLVRPDPEAAPPADPERAACLQRVLALAGADFSIGGVALAPLVARPDLAVT